VDRRVVLQLPAPGMKDAEEAGDITAEVFRVLGQGFNRLRRGLDPEGISKALRAADEGSE
jgi:hypothetical protein